MKHGPIALIDENMPVVFIAPHDAVYEKVLGNIAGSEGAHGRDHRDRHARATDAWRSKVDHVITIPQTLDMLTPILAVDPAAAARVPHRRASAAATSTSRGTWRRA